MAAASASAAGTRGKKEAVASGTRRLEYHRSESGRWCAHVCGHGQAHVCTTYLCMSLLHGRISMRFVRVWESCRYLCSARHRLFVCFFSCVCRSSAWLHLRGDVFVSCVQVCHTTTKGSVYRVWHAAPEGFNARQPTGQGLIVRRGDGGRVRVHPHGLGSVEIIPALCLLWRVRAGLIGGHRWPCPSASVVVAV